MMRRRSQYTIFYFLFSIFSLSSIIYPQSSILGDRYAIIIGGIGGQPEFTEKYFAQTSRMIDLLTDTLGYKKENVIYLFEKPSYDSLKIDFAATAENVREAFNRVSQRIKWQDQLLVFLVGHGTYDGSWGKFNLVGPDLRDIDYAQMLAELPTQKVIFVNTGSASGPFIKKLSGEERVIITATKSGAQFHETNFADFFLDALDSEAADVNKDSKVSVLEAFKFAKATQDRMFEDQRRLRAEHPLLDDNGDGVGSQQFDDSDDGLWASRVSLSPISEEVQTSLQKLESGASSPTDSLRLEKMRLINEVENLKAKKEQLAPEDYNHRLESLLVQLAKTNRQLKKLPGGKKE